MMALYTFFSLISAKTKPHLFLPGSIDNNLNIKVEIYEFDPEADDKFYLNIRDLMKEFTEKDFKNYLNIGKKTSENILEIISSIRMKYIQLGLPTQNVSFDNLEHALKSIFNQDIITLEKQYKSFLLSKNEESFYKFISSKI